MKIIQNKFKLTHESFSKDKPRCIKCNHEINLEEDKFVRGEFGFYNKQPKVFNKNDTSIIEGTEAKLRINLNNDEVNIINIDDVADNGVEVPINEELIQFTLFVCWNCFTKQDFSMGLYRHKMRFKK